MGPVALVAFLVLSAQQSDTSTFRDAATAELYTRARARHAAQDSLVRNYRATVRTRVDLSAGRSRFARQTTLFAHESVAEVRWQAPNDLQLEVLGTRAIVPLVRILAGFGARAELDAEDDIRRQLVFDRPWFIPRALGDSIRLMGVPEHAALHPLADGGTEFYRFAITDSVQLITPSRTVRALLVRVEPKQLRRALVAGDMWIDSETADVVRFAMVFLGDELWGGDSKEANRFLSVEAQVEYALVDQRYWMPYRQFLAITAEIPLFVNLAIPARAVTTFSDYQVNTNPPIAFNIPGEELTGDEERGKVVVRVGAHERLTPETVGGVEEVPDVDRMVEHAREEYGYVRAGTWRDGRWEMAVPPADSLVAFSWTGELDTSYDAAEERRFRETFAELSELSEELPGEWTGHRRLGIAYESVSEIVRFNRVQGLSVGAGYEIRPGLKFTSLLFAGRFGFSDKRPTGSVTLRRDAPEGRLDVRAFHAVTEVEPWTRGLGIGNSINALFIGHDDADYYLRSGGSVTSTWNEGLLQDVEIRLSYEHHRSMETATTSAIAGLWGSRVLPENAPVAEGWFLRGTMSRTVRIGVVTLAPGAEALLGEGSSAVRAWGGVDVGFGLPWVNGVLRARTGVVRGDSLPQMLFRLGGPQTIRGFAYGERTGRAFWTAQLDAALGGPRLIAPVLFVDVGDTFSSDLLIGVGGGMSFLNGLVRIDVAKGLHPAVPVRFDLHFRAPR